MAYGIQITSRALQEYRKLPRQDQRRIETCIDGLAAEPHPPGSRKVTGRLELYRARVGDYRVVYDIRDDVLIVRIGHRRDVYRRMDEL